jgi:SAM-dependent methyltransferase
MGFLLLANLRGSSHIHDKVASLFRPFVPKGRILDVPAGDGVNSRGLAAAGYEVVAADLFPENCPADGFTVVKADLCKPLPFPDASFDGILFSEGIEHIDAQVAALREMARVLRPGGVLVVTTPNTLNLTARLATLLTAHAHPSRALVVRTAGHWDRRREEGGQVYFGHVFLINAFQLRFYLEHAGLRVVAVGTTRWSVNSLLLAPLLLLPIWIATRIALGNRRSKVPAPLRSELLRQMLSPAVVFGSKLVMTAQKRGPE